MYLRVEAHQTTEALVMLIVFRILRTCSGTGCSYPSERNSVLIFRRSAVE